MRISTAGESHGKGLFCIIEGLPAGLTIDRDEIDACLALRQSGYGRGGRQKIERDRTEILSGVRGGITLGSPVCLAVWNRDYENWKEIMAPEGCDAEQRRLTKVRPGHADLTGLKKFGGEDARNILERASARESAVRVAAGTVCRQLLRSVGIEVAGYVRSVGDVCDGREYPFEALSRRLRNMKTRGIAMEKGQTLRDLYERRQPAYLKWADAVVDADGLGVEETVARVVAAVRERGDEAREG